MNRTFEGWYYKHQKGDAVLALIPGRAGGAAFLQVVTAERAYHIPYDLRDYQRIGCANVQVGRSRFSRDGVELDVQTDQLTLTGTLRYRNLTPIATDIMGPFKYLPMECKHSVVSMDHDLVGSMTLNGNAMDFTGGKGYLEGDRGRSFPKSYAWVQCNCFEEPCSVMASVAKIPFAGLQFWGCICVIIWRGKEYRLATYKGARILKRSRSALALAQGKYRLEIDVQSPKGLPLFAPKKGDMTRIIHESANCAARFRFLMDGKKAFDMSSRHASFEYV
ncbi:MAG: tocopherol cyclase family protein [Christensenellales bacterium]